MSRPDDDADRSPDESPIATRSNSASEIPRELHEREDHFGDLQQDLDEVEHERDDEVWFEADALAAASNVHVGADLGADLGTVDPLLRAPSIEALASTLVDPGISLARLPGWPEAGPSGQGLGPAADELIGELRPGDVVVLGGSVRGVGRTSLLAQLGDGLALADDPARPITPVVFVSGAAPSLWRARSLARYFGVDARVFLDPHHARSEPRLAAMLSEFARSPWAELDARQRFIAEDGFATPDRRATNVAALRRFAVEQSDPSDHDRGRSDRSVWPIVIVDPLASIATLAELTRLAEHEGWIVLVSGELGDDPAEARAIDRCASVRLRVATADDHTLALELCHRRLGPRGVGHLAWARASGRFSPLV